MNFTKEYLNEIRGKLQYGDRKVIATVVGCSLELVKKVLSGDRNCRKGKGAKVVKTAVRIIETRKLLEMIRSKDN